MLTRLLVRSSMAMKIPNMYRFSTEVEPVKKAAKVDRPSSIQIYKDGQLITKNFLILKKKEDIEGYVMSVLKNYYRTTNKVQLQVYDRATSTWSPRWKKLD